jgi:subtilase family serine protease
VVTRIEWSPPRPAPGEPVTVRATVRNQGNRPDPAGRADQRRLPGGPAGSDRVVGERSLAPGSEVVLTARTVPTETVWTAVSGDHTVMAETDELDRIRETDERNNALQRMLFVPNKEKQ